MILDPFYLIVDDAAWLSRCLPQGLRLVQLRIKDQPEGTLRGQIRQARAQCATTGAQLIVNDHWQLAIDESCDFIHLGQEDLAAADVPAIRRHGLRMGISTHDETELETALRAGPDYVALGPVFPTILKAMPWGAQGIPRLATWKRQIGTLPLVAIGGLTPARGQACIASGADSVAVVTDVLRHKDPEQRVREWMAETEPWRN